MFGCTKNRKRQRPRKEATHYQGSLCNVYVLSKHHRTHSSQHNSSAERTTPSKTSPTPLLAPTLSLQLTRVSDGNIYGYETCIQCRNIARMSAMICHDTYAVTTHLQLSIPYRTQRKISTHQEKGEGGSGEYSITLGLPQPRSQPRLAFPRLRIPDSQGQTSS